MATIHFIEKKIGNKHNRELKIDNQIESGLEWIISPQYIYTVQYTHTVYI